VCAVGVGRITRLIFRVGFDVSSRKGVKDIDKLGTDIGGGLNLSFVARLRAPSSRDGDEP
jgi:IS4 transposase